MQNDYVYLHDEGFSFSFKMLINLFILVFYHQI